MTILEYLDHLDNFEKELDSFIAGVRAEQEFDACVERINEGTKRIKTIEKKLRHGPSNIFQMMEQARRGNATR